VKNSVSNWIGGSTKTFKNPCTGTQGSFKFFEKFKTGSRGYLEK